MKYFESVKEKLSSLWPMWFVIMLAAIWSIYIQDGQINRDGLLYLKQAYLIAEGRCKEGLALYPWPFFSILIAIFHKITNLHLQVVAHGVDLVLFGIAVLFYLKTLQLVYIKEKKSYFTAALFYFLLSNNGRLCGYDYSRPWIMGRLFVKQNLKKSEYTIINYPKNGKIKSGTIIKNFPENKPKFSLIHNAR